MKKSNIAIIGVWVVCSVALAIFYATAYQGHLRWQAENQIFLNTSHWISTYFDKPAWLGCLFGDWLTQLYAFPEVGAIILTLAISVCAAYVYRIAIRLIPVIPAHTITAMVWLLLVACSMPSSSSLSFFICVGGGLAFGLADFRLSINKRICINLSPLLVIISYWAFGFGALLTAASVILLSYRRGIKELYVSAAGSIILTFGFPALVCTHYALPYTKALFYPGIINPSVPQMEFEKRVAIENTFYAEYQLYNPDFNETKRLALGTDSPNEISAFYYYLASAVQDSLPDNLLKYPVKNLGTLTTIGETTPLPVINMMNDLYYELGDMTYAERAAMMRNVFSPHNRNVRMMQRLAEINLVSGDTLAALKYLRILDNTLLYSKWSKAHMPGNTSWEVDADILRRRANSNTKDNIRLGDNCRNIILELLESNPGNTLALDYLLCTDLLLKDMDTFKMDYDTYCMEKGSPRNKDLYQQALMIYLAGTDAPEEEWRRYIVSDSLLQRFNQYSNHRGDPTFKDTYWYYFDKQ